MLTKTKTKTEHPQTMGCALNNKSTTTEHRIRTDNSLSYRGWGGLNGFTGARVLLFMFIRRELAEERYRMFISVHIL